MAKKYTRDLSSYQADEIKITSSMWNFTLKTGHLYFVKNDHCSTKGCPGIINRQSHYAHPIYSRAKMHLEAFRWQVRFFLLHEGGRVSPTARPAPTDEAEHVKQK
jgi:hypothetical protein